MVSFTFLETWTAPIIIVVFFVFFFIRSLYLVGDMFSSNPLFEKKRTKYINQLCTYADNLTFVVALYYLFLVGKHHEVLYIALNYNGDKTIFLPVFFVGSYVFLLLAEGVIAGKKSKIAGSLQHINSSGLFLLAFVPAGTALIKATNFIHIVLPLELLGLMFYFIFLELSHLGVDRRMSLRWQARIIIRSLMYYFWLNFVGAVFIFLAVLFSSSSSLTMDMQAYKHGNIDLTNKTIFSFISCSCLLFGITIKMGGLFFFFLKAELYKFLHYYSLIIFSIYVTLFYLCIIFVLSIRIVLFLTCFKFYVCIFLFVITALLVASGGLTQRNVLMLSAYSSVLTICFCILALV